VSLYTSCNYRKNAKVAKHKEDSHWNHLYDIFCVFLIGCVLVTSFFGIFSFFKNTHNKHVIFCFF